MKHCLNCYRMLPNDAQVCHYCGAAQAEKVGFPASKFSRCPNCMSYLYTEEHGCPTCGYSAKKKGRRNAGLALLLLALLVAFAAWQLGLIPGLPYSGGVAALLQRTTATPTALTADLTGEPMGETMQAFAGEGEDAGEAVALEPMAETQEAPAAGAQTTQFATAEPIQENTPTATPFLCGGIASQLVPGEVGTIIGGGLSSNVRSEPSTDVASAGVLKQGMTFTVLADAPFCAYNMLWVKIRIDDTGVEGWTVEARNAQYWIAALTPTPTPTVAF